MTRNTCSVQLSIVCSYGLVQMFLPARWNIGDLKKTHKKEGSQNPCSRLVFGHLTATLLFDMVFRAASVRVFVKVEPPVEVVLNRWVVSRK